MIIKKLDDIKYTGEIITFNATVIEVSAEGDGEKKPYKFTAKLEESGETLQCLSWKFDNLETIKTLVLSDEVYEFEANASTYGNYGEQIRVGNIRPTGLRSTKKIIRTHSILEVRREISTLVSKYIKTDIIKLIINKLVLNNEDFFKWPAATKVHHNYEGGLAVHSLGVIKNALSIWENYKGENIDVELLVAGALLHDIGKLYEYNQDGSRTIYGNLIPHSVIGADRVMAIASVNGSDPDKDLKVLMLRHIILTHHEKLEFGASTLPYIQEAWIVANADNMDARVESMNVALSNLSMYQNSDQLISLDRGRVLKWK